jgi:hypothetical protein
MKRLLEIGRKNTFQLIWRIKNYFYCLVWTKVRRLEFFFTSTYALVLHRQNKLHIYLLPGIVAPLVMAASCAEVIKCVGVLLCVAIIYAARRCLPRFLDHQLVVSLLIMTLFLSSTRQHMCSYNIFFFDTCAC